MPKRQNFVTFLSPGTLFSESSTKPIDQWDVAEASRMADEIQERYNAKPYGFQFSTSIVADPIPDGEGGTLRVESRRVAASGIYYLGGELLRYCDLLGVPKMEIACENMRCNRQPIIIRNTNSWMFHGEFAEDACIVENGVVVTRGDDHELVEYRRKTNAEFQQYFDRESAKLSS